METRREGDAPGGRRAEVAVVRLGEPPTVAFILLEPNTVLMSSSPPGPRGEPLFGSSRRYARDPFRFLSALEQAYGDVVQFDLGPLDTYLLTDPIDIERVLVSEADKYRKPDFQNDALGDLLGKGLLLSEGQQWREQRQLANPAFDMRRVMGFADDIVAHNDDLLADWTDGEVVNVELDMTEV